MDEIIVGTYEGFLLGFTLTIQNEVQKLKQTFATHSHTAAVRCVSLAGKYLASGGTDDKVVVIDLKSRKEHTVLMSHDGTINTVEFTNGGSHLLTGSDDGYLIVTRTGNWQMEKKWKKSHGGQPVTAITVHPSDKLALSIGGDKTLRTWNLVKGRPAFTINLASKGVTLPTDIKFAPSGDRFALISQQTVDVWTISKAGVEKRITCNSKPSCINWVTDEKLFIGLDNGNLISLEVSETKAKTYHAHKQRVKCLHYDNDHLYSASSAGELKVWLVKKSMELVELCSHNVAGRITCMTLNKQSVPIKKEDTDNGEAVEDNTKAASESEDEVLETPAKLKRKPGAFVTISYGEEAIEDNKQEPLKKKLKRKKNNKKNKIRAS